jgi:IS5 family transposase
MRTKSLEELYLNFSRPSRLKVVKEYRKKYEAISEVLADNPEVISLAHRDWSRALSVSSGGRRSGYTSEEILRALVVMFAEGDSYREVVVRIENSQFLQHFVGLGPKPMMDYTFLSKAFGSLSEETWQAMNGALSRYATEENKITGEKLRLDTTVYETNIHYPTDSSLLWDSFRTLARILKRVQKEFPELEFRHRYHVKKVKKLSYFIARNGGSKNKSRRRKVKRVYRTLIARVRWIVGIAEEMLEVLKRDHPHGKELGHYIALVKRIIDQAEKRIFEGIILPPSQKVYSLFEEHTELLKRGKARKPIEFGHKVLLAQTKEKFIHHYEVLPRQRDDAELLGSAITTHQRLFGGGPDVLATDKGFYKNMGQIENLEENIETVSICKKGRRTSEQQARERTEAFIAGQRFRAGCEGSISVLKRVFKLGLCLFKGFKNYAASVGCAVFCHNLIVLTRL